MQHKIPLPPPLTLHFLFPLVAVREHTATLVCVCDAEGEGEGRRKTEQERKEEKERERKKELTEPLAQERDARRGVQSLCNRLGKGERGVVSGVIGLGVTGQKRARQRRRESEDLLDREEERTAAEELHVAVHQLLRQRF